MNVEAALLTVLSAVIGGVIGGGSVAGLLYRATKDRLIEDLVKIFARRSALDAVDNRVSQVNERVTGVLSVATMARDAADTNSASVIRLQEADEHRWEPLGRIMERFEARLEKNEEALTRTIAMLDALERRVDRHQDGGGPG